jgi:hypothetical protein
VAVDESRQDRRARKVNTLRIRQVRNKVAHRDDPVAIEKQRARAWTAPLLSMSASASIKIGISVTA